MDEEKAFSPLVVIVDLFLLVALFGALLVGLFFVLKAAEYSSELSQGLTLLV